jgi:DNA-binding NarL/FixJ family response regulator
MTCRILVVEDYEPFRRVLCAKLQQRPEFQVIGQAADGSEAVHQGAELQPDLVLLDIGLPTLNGIDAAKRILSAAPHSKILFLSQEASPEVVEEALCFGMGYVQKTHLHRDLLPAIEAVLQGRRFISASLEVPQLVEAATDQASHRHEVVFYSSDAGFLEGFTEFIARTLTGGKAAVVVATESHRDGLVRTLKTHGMDIDGAIQRGTYFALDAASTLTTMMVKGLPDRERLFERVDGLIHAVEVQQQYRGISACGETAPLLLGKGEEEAAIRVEQFWDDLGRTRGMEVVCAYPLSTFPGGQESEAFKRICAEHSAVYFR